ncbi:glycosyltransferase family 2 protein [Paenibacillus sp. CAU 1782]
METLLGCLAAVLGFQWLYVLWNLNQMPQLTTPSSGQAEGGKAMSASRRRTTDGSASLSVLIPARNEEGKIGRCIQSVLAQDWPSLELLVLDDRSEDDTRAEALEAIRSAGHRDGLTARVLDGAPLPPGITGKSHACMQLARVASGQWLLFLDSDAELGNDALAAAMAMAQQQGAGLITGFPRQVTGSWLERLVVPLMSFVIACHLPIPMVRKSPNPAFVAAHGAFMLVHSASYEACGGHAALGKHLLDDMELARRIKSSGNPMTLANLCNHVSMRMYNDAGGVWNGYRKNLFPGLGRSHPLLLFIMIYYSLLYILPPLALAGAVAGLLPGSSLLPAALCCLLGMLIKLTIDRHHRRPLQDALLIAPGIAALLAIAAASWHGSVTGKGYSWKGRRYL